MQRLMKIRIITLLCLMVFPHAIPYGSAAVQTVPPTLELRANTYRIEAEVAATRDSRTLGLMYRYSLPANHGMLFVFPEERAPCMCMKNTRIPLSAAFLDSNGMIVNIAEMEPGSKNFYCASRPIQYVLEVNRGWFLRRGMGAGARIIGLEKAPAGQ